MSRVCVLMTIYNAAPYLATAIDSLLGQSFSDWQLIAVENGSTDDSGRILQGYDDPRIKAVYLDENIGRTPALNLALELAEAPFIAILDADDVALPDRLLQEVAYFESHPRCVLIGTHCALIDSDGAPIGNFTPLVCAAEIYQQLAYANVFAHSSVLFRKEAALAAGGYPDEFSYASDYGLWIRMVGTGDFAILPQQLTQIRQHGGQASVADTFVVARSSDAISLFREASYLSGLRKESIIRNRIAESWECGRMAKIMLSRGCWMAAARWGTRGLARSPYHFLRKLLNPHAAMI